jgi:hypothetical protein
MHRWHRDGPSPLLTTLPLYSPIDGLSIAEPRSARCLRDGGTVNYESETWFYVSLWTSVVQLNYLVMSLSCICLWVHLYLLQYYVACRIVLAIAICMNIYVSLNWAFEAVDWLCDLVFTIWNIGSRRVLIRSQLNCFVSDTPNIISWLDFLTSIHNHTNHTSLGRNKKYNCGCVHVIQVFLMCVVAWGFDDPCMDGQNCEHPLLVKVECSPKSLNMNQIARVQFQTVI